MSTDTVEANIRSEPTVSSPTACTRCGAPVHNQRSACGYCGASFASMPQTDPVREVTVIFVRSLQKESKEFLSAWLMISMVALFVVPILLLFGLPWLGMNWVAGLTVAVMSFPPLFIWVGYVDEKERQRLFCQRLLPQIQRFLVRHDMSSAELIAIARQELGKNSALLHMLSRI